MTFGEVIAQARKDKKLSQKQMASVIVKEEGGSISAQYLNDIEHDRRNPPSEYIIRQVAKILELDQDYLFYLAGRLPSDMLDLGRGEKEVSQAMKVFRRNLRGGKR